MRPRRSLLRDRNFRLYLLSVVTRVLPTQMMAVAVGWQVYAIHRHPFDIGLVGLAEFVPLPLLALPTGQLADRVSRRFVVLLALIVGVVNAVLLLVVTVDDLHRVRLFVALGVLTGITNAFGTPSARAMAPELVAREDVPAAMALRTTANQVGIVVGPAVGGLLLAVSAASVYAAATVMFVIGLWCTAAIVVARPARGKPAPGLAHLLGGVRFLRRSRLVFGAVLLDLFAVLFGGAVALLPAFARDILHVGPIGLGILRSAPAVGALAAGAWLARRPTTANAGPRLLGVVALFGAATIVFGLSRWFAVSLLALAVTGLADMLSVNIRSTTVALATPDELRGRVNAVEMVFISASNQLGAFESGAAAALLGIVPSVVVGGAVTIGVAALWSRLFPSLARLDRLDTLHPEAVAL
ncbi:MAG: MFS transporter [Actinomycetota bacterium]